MRDGLDTSFAWNYPVTKGSIESRRFDKVRLMRQKAYWMVPGPEAYIMNVWSSAASEESLIKCAALPPEEAKKVPRLVPRQLADLGRERVVEWSDFLVRRHLADATARVAKAIRTATSVKPLRPGDVVVARFPRQRTQVRRPWCSRRSFNHHHRRDVILV